MEKVGAAGKDDHPLLGCIYWERWNWRGGPVEDPGVMLAGTQTERVVA